MGGRTVECGLFLYEPVLLSGALTGFDSGELRCRKKIESTKRGPYGKELTFPVFKNSLNKRAARQVASKRHFRLGVFP